MSEQTQRARRPHPRERFGLTLFQWVKGQNMALAEEAKSNIDGLSWTGRYFHLWMYCNPGTRIDPIRVTWGEELTNQQCEELIAKHARAIPNG